MIGLSPAGLVIFGHRIHYSWGIVAVAALIWTTSSSVRFAASILVPEFESKFHWSYFSIVLAITMQWIISGLLGPVVGWLGDRYGVQRVMLGGAVLFVIGMILVGTMNQAWQFWLYFGVILGVAMAIFQVNLVAAVPLWFKTNLGLAMGSLQGLQGIGTAFMILILYVLSSNFGLKWTFWGPGIVGGVILLLAIRGFHNEPAEVGLRPYGASPNEPIRSLQNNETAKVRTSVFQMQAQKTPTFWNLIGIHFWGCAGHNIILVLLIAMIKGEDISTGIAVSIFITMNVVSTITRFFVPLVADRAGSKGVMGISFMLQALPVLLLLVAHDPWLFYVFAILFGIGMGGEMTAFPIINRQYYGDAPTGTTYGYQMLGGGLGMALGPLLGAFLKDATGGFNMAVILSFTLSLIGAISIFVLPATRRHQIPQWEDMLPEEIRFGSPRPQASGHAHGAPGALGSQGADSD